MSETQKLFRLERTIELGAAWGGNSVNCVPFRTDGIVLGNETVRTAYFNNDGAIVVAEADTLGYALRSYRLEGAPMPRDAHQAISLGHDANGRLHIACGAHASSLFVCRSNTSRLDDGFSPLRALKGQYTYPMFVRGRSDLLMLYRVGDYKAGEIYVSRLDSEQEEWINDDRPLFSGLGGSWTSGPYLNTPVVDHIGSMHLFLCWRLQDEASSAGRVANMGIDGFVSDDDLLSLQTHKGIKLTRPITPSNSERVVPVPLGASLINQASAGLLAKDKPAFLTFWDSGDGIPQYQLGWKVASGWKVRRVSDFRTPFRLDGGGTLPLPHSRPELLVHPGGNISVLFRSIEFGNRLVAAHFKPPAFSIKNVQYETLIDEDLDSYEPVICRSAWKEKGTLVIYSQKCAQLANNDGLGGNLPAKASLRFYSLIGSRP